MDAENVNFEALKLEYTSLKAEQLKRIEHRDQIVYLQIIVIGTLLGLASDFSEGLVAFVIPFPCIALGWIYLINDEKVSALGRYIRHELSNKALSLINCTDTEEQVGLFGWEVNHRTDKHRRQRKIIQLFIDIFVFVLPGFLAVTVNFSQRPNTLELIICLLQTALLLVLLWQIVQYADLKKGK